MNIKKWVVAIGILLIVCGPIFFVMGIGANYLKDATQANNYSALISYWKKGFLLEIFGIVVLIMSSAFSSGGKN